VILWSVFLCARMSFQPLIPLAQSILVRAWQRHFLIIQIKNSGKRPWIRKHNIWHQKKCLIIDMSHASPWPLWKMTRAVVGFRFMMISHNRCFAPWHRYLLKIGLDWIGLDSCLPSSSLHLRFDFTLFYFDSLLTRIESHCFRFFTAANCYFKDEGWDRRIFVNHVSHIANRFHQFYSNLNRHWNESNPILLCISPLIRCFTFPLAPRSWSHFIWFEMETLTKNCNDLLCFQMTCHHSTTFCMNWLGNCTLFWWE
jgi:hypothetical protein